jgi:predicted nucleic acid-binding Zn ribbon protein
MRYCPRCGTPLEADAMRCSGCSETFPDPHRRRAVFFFWLVMSPIVVIAAAAGMCSLGCSERFAFLFAFSPVGVFAPWSMVIGWYWRSKLRDGLRRPPAAEWRLQSLAEWDRFLALPVMMVVLLGVSMYFVILVYS